MFCLINQSKGDLFAKGIAAASEGGRRGEGKRRPDEEVRLTGLGRIYSSRRYWYRYMRTGVHLVIVHLALTVFQVLYWI